MENESPEDERENNAGIAKSRAVALNSRSNDIAVEELSDNPDTKDQDEAHKRTINAKICQWQRDRETGYRAEEWYEIEHAEQEADDKAIRKRNQSKAQSIENALEEADDYLPAEEVDNDVEKSIFHKFHLF